MLADDVIVEYVISVPGYPKRVKGRKRVINLYSDYDSYMSVQSADNLRVYHDPKASVAVLEYEVHGKSVQGGRPYDNRFVSIVTIENGKVTKWRDYLDPIAVFDALGWPVSRQTSNLTTSAQALVWSKDARHEVVKTDTLRPVPRVAPMSRFVDVSNGAITPHRILAGCAGPVYDNS